LSVSKKPRRAQHAEEEAVEYNAACQTCRYISRVLGRTAACEQHAKPQPGNELERQDPAPETTVRLSVESHAPFLTREFLRLLFLRSHLRDHLAAGGLPDDLPVKLWRRTRA
jgi:hypothetical protein